MVASSATRDRILDVAMELFSEQGFRGTSITDIETAAGLTPGAGGIYHHFRTKDSLLEAGLKRHLDRVLALRDITRLLAGLGDLRASLTVVARYVLTELDNEQALLRILATEARARPHLMDDRFEGLIKGSYAGFASWLANEADIDDADAIAAVGLGALLSSRLVSALFGVKPTDVSDELFVATWVDMMVNTLNGD
jgi:AcrR family transcriptional regulator